MDLALGVAVGSSMQIALLVTPLMVIIGWGMDVEMSLLFNVFETAVMLISVVMVNYLMMVSLIHAPCTFFIPHLGSRALIGYVFSYYIGWQKQLARRFHAVRPLYCPCNLLLLLSRCCSIGTWGRESVTPLLFESPHLDCTYIPCC